MPGFATSPIISMAMGRGFSSSIVLEMVTKERIFEVEYLQKKTISKHNMMIRRTYCCLKVKFFITYGSIKFIHG
jgi:hypothetical protein